MGLRPCRECPFRKTALPGYVGGHSDPAEIIQVVFVQEQKFPCHMEVTALLRSTDVLEDEEDPLEPTTTSAFEQACEEARHCHGALICMNNSAKRSRNFEIAKLQDEAGKSDDVFGRRDEFLEYHKSEQYAALKTKTTNREKRRGRKKRNDQEAREP